MDKDKHSRHSPASSHPANPEADELYRKLSPEMRRPKPSADALAAALEAAQRLAAEVDAEDSVADSTQDLAGSTATSFCRICGHRNRSGNKFCSMCGVATVDPDDSAMAGNEERRPRAIALHPNPFLDPEPQSEPQPHQEFLSEPERMPSSRPTGQETHHYHHHYHHHYFPGANEGMMSPRASSDPREIERVRPTAAALRGDMSRAEAAVRRITQEWVLACNTKHLDDLLELYVADALVFRSNYPPVRGAAAVREFYFGALDAGLGEVEIDPLRVDVAGELAYEAGRFKALVPSATGKRREERGKYVWVCSRQSNGEWKLVIDCWSSDLALTTLESDIPAGAQVKSTQPRKGT